MDLKEVFSEFMNKKEKFSFSEALSAQAIDFEGSPHCGLDDARNCAKLAHKMHRNNAFFRITKDLNQHELNRHF
jgi:inhibitor of KinA sporulation pathway (predicted exonuclease)